MKLLATVLAVSFLTAGPTIVVAADAGKTGAAGSPPAANLGAMHQGMAKPVDAGDVKVPKAAGADARTVADIVGGSAALSNKPVVVRGKVVKFTPGVMGRNWLHLRDGTGSAADNTHDVVVTTKDETKVGDVVVAKGTVRTDVDIGAGYFYKVLVEDAKLTK
jgi:hypothetical protein